MPEAEKPVALAPKQLWRHKKFRYLVIGAWNTLAGYLIFAGLYMALGHYTGYMIIAVVSHLIAVTQSFLTQRHIVFRSAGKWTHEYLRFHLAHLGSLLIALVALPIMVEIFAIPPLIAQGILTALIALASYFVHQHFTFRKTEDV
jgi:putative flippase GtrA